MAQAAPDGKQRWYRLVACILAMMAIANLQYAWTLFTTPLTEGLNATLTAVQVAFGLFGLTQTWLVPINAYFVDRLGPRIVVSLAAVLVGVGWIGAGLATSLGALYVSYAIGGVGAGAVYGACVGLAMKWFPDRRGFCVGLVAGSYGAGTALTVLPISSMIETSGYGATFVTWGVIQGVVVLIAAQFLAMPPVNWAPAGWNPATTKTKVQQSTRDYTPAEMVKTPSFYMLYVMMTMVAFSGLMVVAQLKPIANSYGFDKMILLGLTSALNFALLLDRIMNGLARPFFGWVSDHIGRYDTMALAFGGGALTISILTLFVDRPIWFVVLTGLTFFAWGEIYSLFPSAIADIYGSKHATTNYGIQYTSKGFATMLAGPGATALWAMSNSWVPVLWTAAACNAVAAFLALFWLKPLVKRLLSQQQAVGEVPKIATAEVASREAGVSGGSSSP